MSHFTPEDHLKAIGAVEVSPRPQEGHTGASFAATLFTLIDPSEIPPRAFLYGRHLIRKHVSVTVAPGGLGKSALTLAEAVAMATGRDFLKPRVAQPLRVWVWNLEDPHDELQRRLAAICQYYGVTGDDLGGRLFVDSGREQELCTAVTERGGTSLREDVIDRLIDELQSKNIDVLIVDPFISSHQVSENDNPAMDMVTKAWGRVADQANAAISLVHHTRKQSTDGETTADSARGAKSLVDAARDVRCLTRMTKEQGEEAGVGNHRAYFRVYSDPAP
jgi:RecA-family ATPase